MGRRPDSRTRAATRPDTLVAEPLPQSSNRVIRRRALTSCSTPDARDHPLRTSITLSLSLGTTARDSKSAKLERPPARHDVGAQETDKLLSGRPDKERHSAKRTCCRQQATGAQDTPSGFRMSTCQRTGIGHSEPYAPHCALGTLRVRESQDRLRARLNHGFRQLAREFRDG